MSRALLALVRREHVRLIDAAADRMWARRRSVAALHGMPPRLARIGLYLASRGLDMAPCRGERDFQQSYDLEPWAASPRRLRRILAQGRAEAQRIAAGADRAPAPPPVPSPPAPPPPWAPGLGMAPLLGCSRKGAE